MSALIAQERIRDPLAANADATICFMTAKELLLKHVPEWSEEDAEVALRAVERKHDADARPGDTVDAWGNLSAMARDSTARAMRRLAEEEAAAGHAPW
jgi:hypothetical protein